MNAAEPQTMLKKKTQTGKNEAVLSFDQIYKQHHQGLCRYAQRFTQCSYTAEEIVNEVFLKYWKQRETLVVHTSVYSYLAYSTRNLCIDYLRRKNRKGGWASELSGDFQADYANPSEVLIGHETQHLIDRAIDSLSSKCRQIFRMSREANMTYAEIAAAMDLSVKTVEAHMGRSLKQLRERLQYVRV